MYCFQACVCTECGRATPKRPSPGQGQDAPNSTAPLSTESSATALSDDEFRRDTEVVHRFAAARETARPERYTSQPGGRGGDRKTAKNRGMVIKIGDPSAHESARPLSGGAVASPTKLIIDNIIDTPIELAPSRRFDDVDLLEFQDSLDSKTDSKKTLATRPKGSTAAVQPGLPEPLLPTILFNRKEQVEERDSVNLLD